MPRPPKNGLIRSSPVKLRLSVVALRPVSEVAAGAPWMLTNIPRIYLPAARNMKIMIPSLFALRLLLSFADFSHSSFLFLLLRKIIVLEPYCASTMSVYRTGLTELHPGRRIDGQPPKARCPSMSTAHLLKLLIDRVSVVFIHGLGGHPQRTWSANSPHQRSDSKNRLPSNSLDTSTFRKGSLFTKFTFKRSKTSTLGPTLSITESAYAAEPSSSIVSPSDSSIGLLETEPLDLDSQATGLKASIALDS